LNSYIVRIYRHEQNDPGSIVGTVEDVEHQSRMPFTNLNELWEILSAGKRGRPGAPKQGGGHAVEQ